MHHDEADDFDDRELPDPQDMSSGDEPGLEVCPHCRRMVSEEAERCPHCGRYISFENRPASATMFITLVVIILVLVLAGIVAWLV